MQGTIHLTSFFDDEKKLGSYLIRLLPLLIGLFIFHFTKRKAIVELIIIIITTIAIFYSSERVALALLIFFYLIYFFICKFKIIYVLLITSIIFSLLAFNEKFKYKYIDYTNLQTGLIFLKEETLENKKKKK